MEISLDWQVALLFVFAASLAAYIRAKDTPALVFMVGDKVQWTAVAIMVETWFVSLGAALLMAWFLAEQDGVLISTWGGFIAITMAALGGMATIRSLLNHTPAAAP